MVLEMVADAARLAHAGCRDDDAEAAEAGERLRILDALRDAHVRRGEGAAEIAAVLQFAGVLDEDGGGLGGERTVDEDRGLGHLALVHQLDEVGDQFLGALHREGRDEKCTLLLCRLVHLARQDLAAAVLAALEAVTPAIGRLADHEIEIGRRLRIGLQHLVVGPQVTREQQAQRLGALLLHLDLDRGRAQQVAGIPVARPDAGCGRDPHFIGVALEMRERVHRILLGVDRLHQILTALGATLVELLHFHLLDVARVRQHDGAEVRRGGGAMDAVLVAVLDELRQHARMIDVGMGEKHRGDGARIEGEGPVVQLALGLRTLEHAAIDEHFRAVGFDQVAGAGDGARCAMELQTDRHAHSTPGRVRPRLTSCSQAARGVSAKPNRSRSFAATMPLSTKCWKLMRFFQNDVS